MSTVFDSTVNDQDPQESPIPSQQRKKLLLKPRSRPNRQRQSSRTSGSDLFGGGKPREQVLAQRGVDPTAMDKRIETKARVHRYNPEQEQELSRIRSELTEAEAHLREANEKELPAEMYRIAVEDKRQALQGLITKFDKVNLVSKPPLEDLEEGELSPRSTARKERYPRIDMSVDNKFATLGYRRRSNRSITEEPSATS